MKNSRIAIITGGSTGIGKALSLKLAHDGYTIGIISRNAERARIAKNDIISSSGNQNIELFTADLSSQKQIHSLVDKLNKAYTTIDVLVNNAGIYENNFLLTEDNLERTIAVNHLAPFLLTNLLLKKNMVNKTGRIITLSSVAHALGKIHFDDLNLKKNYNGWKAYCQSKLANILFSNELAIRLKGRSITSNCLHPGTVKTQVLHDIPAYISFFSKFVAIDPDKGSLTPYYLATSDEVKNISGKYFFKNKVINPMISKNLRNRQKELWALSEKLCHL